MTTISGSVGTENGFSDGLEILTIGTKLKEVNLILTKMFRVSNM